MNGKNKKGNTAAIMLAVALGTFIAALDSSVVNIAFPYMKTYFHTTLYTIEWVMLSYLLVISSLLLMFGRLGDIYGHKRIYLSGLIVFTAGSFLCGIAPTVGFLIFARVVQALGAGMLMSMGPAIITETVLPEVRGKALSVTAVTVAVALTVGPVLGGLLTTLMGWRSIFYINIPIGCFGIFWTARSIPDREPGMPQKFDIKGCVTISTALISIILSLNLSANLGLNNPFLLILLSLGIALILIFAVFERKIQFPMVDMGLFDSRLFTMSNISALFNYMSMFMVVLMLPLYLEGLLMLPPSRAGLFFIPMPLATMLIAPISGALSDRMDSRYISAAGMVIMAFGIWMLSNIVPSSSTLIFMLSASLVGLGSGLFQTPNNSAIMGDVPKNRRGIASGMLATMRNIGMALGIGTAGAVFSANEKMIKNSLSAIGHISAARLAQASFLGAVQNTYIIASVIALLAAGSSLIKGSTKKNFNG